jgi:hypothetical protein
MKILALLLLTLALGCKQTETSQGPLSTPDVAAPVSVPEVIEPSQTAPIATIIEHINSTDLEKAKNLKAIERIRETVMSGCFQKAWLERELIQTNGKTNVEILKEIINADVKIRVSMYRSWKNTVGYTYPSSDTIWCNRKFHDNMDPCDAGANLFHEILHKLGYQHDVKPNKQRPFSVPYSGGTLMDQCCQEKR